MSGPTEYIQDTENPNTPKFGGVAIDMKRLADEKGYDYSYLSKIFGGTRMPGPKFAKRLAEDLGMTLPDLYACCEQASTTRQQPQF